MERGEGKRDERKERDRMVDTTHKGHDMKKRT